MLKRKKYLINIGAALMIAVLIPGTSALAVGQSEPESAEEIILQVEMVKPAEEQPGETVYQPGEALEQFGISEQPAEEETQDAVLSEELPALDGAILASGSCGESVTWKIENTSEGNILTISGTGRMEDFETYFRVPWLYRAPYIEKAIIEEGVTHLGNSTFYNCKQLREIVFPTTLESMGGFVFRLCDKLENITIPEGVVSVDLWCICECEAVKSITLPSTLKRVGVFTIDRCPNLTEVKLTEGITDLSNLAIVSCPNLKTVTVPASITYIGDKALGYGASDVPNQYTAIEGFTIRGYKGTAAETYAKENGFTFKELAEKCTVALDPNGGSVDTPSLKVTKGSKYGTLPTPTRKYYTFTGWYTEKSGGTKVTSAAICNGSGTLYAHWKSSLLPAPKVLKAVSATNGVKVTWEALKGAELYKVMYREDGGKWTTAGYTTGTGFTWKKAVNGHTYAFTVRSMKSDKSEYTSDYDRQGVSVTYYTVPVLTKLTNTASGVKVQWEAVEGVSRYRVMYKTEGGSWATAGYSNSTGYTVKKLTLRENYSFTVRCVNADNTPISSYNSTGLSQKWMLPSPSVSTPKNLGTGVEVSWKAVTGAERYRVMYRTENGSWTTAGSTTDTAYVVKKLTVGETYYFTVRCYTADGKTATSTYDTVGKSIVRKMTSPTVSKLTNTSAGVKVQWEASEGAEMYKVYYRLADSTDWKTGGYTTGTSYTVKGLVSGKKYAFAIRCATPDKKTALTSLDKVGTSIVYKAQ